MVVQSNFALDPAVDSQRWNHQARGVETARTWEFSFGRAAPGEMVAAPPISDGIGPYWLTGADPRLGLRSCRLAPSLRLSSDERLTGWGVGGRARCIGDATLTIADG